MQEPRSRGNWFKDGVRKAFEWVPLQIPLDATEDRTGGKMGVLKSWTSAIVAMMAAEESLGFNADPSPAWCGKPYMSSSQAIDPGGQFQHPTPQADPLLYVALQPRYSIFLESDESGSFIIDATISHIFGQAYTNISYHTPGSSTGSPFTTLDYDIFSEESGAQIVSNSVPLNSTANLIGFSFTSFTPRLQPYAISLYGTSPDGQQSFAATTEIYILPSRTYGSAVKVDNLYGGLYVQNAFNNWDGWYPVFPNGGYADGGYVSPPNINFAGLDMFVSQGFNTINIVPDGGLPDQSYPVTELEQYWDHMDSLNLFNVYDMRFAFQNSTRINEQVALWQNRATLLMWYTADEPDGWMYPLNSTSLAYAQLKTLDPYHPVSLVLNCQNFFYEEYAAGADIILEDAYPVGINATWSIPWSTPCNLTYGDCGCDNCIDSLTDVASRLDDLQEYQGNLQGQGMKPTWATVQIFGEQEYWRRTPSVAEVENMMMLSINHNAKGLTYWIYPSSSTVNIGSGALGKVFKTSPGIDFIFGSNAIKGLEVQGEALVDASAWIVGSQMMVGVASGEYVDFEEVVTITLPLHVVSVNATLWGNGGWSVSGIQLMKTALKALEVGMVVLDIS